MSVTIKAPHEIEKMRESCKRLAVVHDEIGKLIRPGVSTWELDRQAFALIKELGGTPNFLHYNGYPATICASVNEVVVHGIPSKDIVLKEGDIIGLDLGMIYEGYHSDAARTHLVGNCSEEDRKLVEVTKQSFFEGVKFAREGCHLYDISAAIQKYAESFGYGVVRDMVGHGIGTRLHEDPEVPNFKPFGRGKGLMLRAGMTLAIEPMISAGTWRIEVLEDGWTTVTADGKKNAHYENTVLITEGDPEILTLYRDGREV